MTILSMNHISYECNGTKILENICLNVDKGDCISIVGQSGSGKSTLLKLCSDLITPSRGELTYSGIKYEDWDPIELRRKISYCIQTPVLFGDTVLHNLELPFHIRNVKVNKKLINELLSVFNLDNNLLGKDCNSLSGGEKQRIAMIRNLLFPPDILLLDEVTASLDYENGKIVERYIEELNTKGITVIWITHNMEQSYGIFNKRITLSKGNIENLEDLKS